jgi:hypothetical protein
MIVFLEAFYMLNKPEGRLCPKESPLKKMKSLLAFKKRPRRLEVLDKRLGGFLVFVLAIKDHCRNLILTSKFDMIKS